jgi:hypothetical protein
MESALELTPQQARALRQNREGMLDLIDPTTGELYVLISRSAWERLQEEAEDTRQILGWERSPEQGTNLALQNEA